MKKISIKLPDKKTLRRNSVNAGIVCLGTLFMAFGNMAFINPYNIIPGGFAGLAIILNKTLLDFISPGVLIIIFNAPLFIIAYKIKGKDFGFLSLVGTVSYAIFINILSSLMADGSSLKETMDNITEKNELLAALYGGAIMGIGYGICIRRGGSTGGTDTLSNIMNAVKPTYSFGMILFVIDGVIVALSGVAFGVNPALYAMIVVFLSAIVSDMMIEGNRSSRAYYIACSDPDTMARVIFERLGRGVTALKARGMYTKTEREVLMCVVMRLQSPTLKRIVFETDPKSFVYSQNLSEVFGEGFKPPEKPKAAGNKKKKSAAASASKDSAAGRV